MSVPMKILSGTQNALLSGTSTGIALTIPAEANALWLQCGNPYGVVSVALGVGSAPTAVSYGDFTFINSAVVLIDRDITHIGAVLSGGSEYLIVTPVRV